MKEKKLFVIVKKTKDSKIPYHAFIDDSYYSAKLYFYGYLSENNCREFELKQIGTFTKSGLTTNNIFITGGFECMSEQRENKRKISQMKMKFELNKYKSNEEQVKDIFEGEFIQ